MQIKYVIITYINLGLMVENENYEIIKAIKQ
jgi:hypothetical protein